MEYSDTVKATLMVPQNQERIAGRLGKDGFEEWTFHRQKQLRKNKPATFQTFCDWIETKAATFQACKSPQQTHSRELNPKANSFTARQIPPRENFQGQTRYQSPQQQVQTGGQGFRTEV